MEPRAYKSGAGGTPPGYPSTSELGYPRSESDGLGATLPGPWWFYMTGEEARNLMITGRIAPSPHDNTQMLQAISNIRIAAIPAPPPPAPPRMLDPYKAGGWAALGLVQLIGDYNGPLIRVRRSSDNAEANIGYTSTGALDDEALLAHVGSGDGFISREYDQFGHGNDFHSPSNAQQPRIVSGGVRSARIQWNTGGTPTVVKSVNQTPGTAAGQGMSFMYEYEVRSYTDPNVPIFFCGNMGITGHNGGALQYQVDDFFNVAYYFQGPPVGNTYDRISWSGTGLLNVATESACFRQNTEFRIFGFRNGNALASTVGNGVDTYAPWTPEFLYIGDSGGNTTDRAFIDLGIFVAWNRSLNDADGSAVSALALPA